MRKNHSSRVVTDQGNDARHLFEHTLPTHAAIDPHGTKPPARIPVSIVTNSCLLEEGLVQLLGMHLNLELVGSYGEQFPDTAQLLNPDGHVVLVDGGLGQAAIMNWIRFWRGRVPVVYVLVLELINDPDRILACIEAGAHGYTLQGASAAEVAVTISEIMQGRAQCSPEVVARVFARLAAHGMSTPTLSCLKVPLTDREMQVLQYLARDYSNQEIAAQLVIEVRTVKHHVHNILEKLQLHHRWDAARMAIEQGWIKDHPQNDSPPT
jgi:DNA-binding NarL/FixJ family response regulator